ncbi:GLPGLI family protein [Olleya namhaensis]|uniref:GLPGLI family protein n=1 Tax=Olleya namhaensis TaxID=1144750 RepID=UPI00232B9F2B|nr:GLPGLI family protein [Olleya namhaensis]
MKINIIIFLFFYSFVCFGQSENGIAIYLKKSITEETNVSVEVKGHIKLLEENLSKLEYQLAFNKHFTLFKENVFLESSEVDGMGLKMARIVAGIQGDIYFNLNTKETVIRKDFLGEIFLVKSQDTINSWTLTKESKNVGSYKCFKATKKEIVETRRGDVEVEVVAWYTPEININSGPEGYAGLPGLIIELTKGRIVTYLKSISFSNDQIKIELPKKGKNITEVEFNKVVKKATNMSRN